MFEGIICSELRAKDRRAQGKMSGPDGSNQLQRPVVPAPLLSQNIWFGAEPEASPDPNRAGIGQVPVFSENLKDQGDEAGLLAASCGCSG